MARWRRKVSEEELARLGNALEDARRNATTEIRDGREFTVLRLPDRLALVIPADDETERPRADSPDDVDEPFGQQ